MVAARAVLKVGGGLLASPDAFASVVAAIAAADPRGLVIVPGGGPFADAVRAAAERFDIDDSTAHWMAIAAMDQFGMMLAARLDRGSLVRTPREIATAAADGRIAIVAPSRWLREEDPLPHSWAVTSDSIAAWVAGRIGAPRVIMIKPPGARGDVTDRYFPAAVTPGVEVSIVSADQIDRLTAMLAPAPQAST